MKYLELIKGQFTADHEARAKQEEPYVAYSVEADGVMYNFIPEQVARALKPNQIAGMDSETNGLSYQRDYIVNDGTITVVDYQSTFPNLISDSIPYWELHTFSSPVTKFKISQNSIMTAVMLPHTVTEVDIIEAGFFFREVRYDGTIQEWEDNVSFSWDPEGYYNNGLSIICTDGTITLVERAPNEGGGM